MKAFIRISSFLCVLLFFNYCGKDETQVDGIITDYPHRLKEVLEGK